MLFSTKKCPHLASSFNSFEQNLSPDLITELLKGAQLKMIDGIKVNSVDHESLLVA
jgi:hypothetical protein